MLLFLQPPFAASLSLHGEVSFSRLLTRRYFVLYFQKKSIFSRSFIYLCTYLNKENHAQL